MTFKSKSIWKLISKCEKSSWVDSLNQGSTLPSESFRQLDQEISGGFAVRRPDSSLCIPVLQLYRILQHQHVPFCILLGLFLSPYNWKVSFNDWPVTLNPIGSLVGFIFLSRVNQKVSKIVFLVKNVKKFKTIPDFFVRRKFQQINSGPKMSENWFNNVSKFPSYKGSTHRFGQFLLGLS